MNYAFKWKEELAWALLATVGLFILQLMTAFDASEALADPRTYANAAFSGLVRSLGVGLLSFVKALAQAAGRRIE